MANKKIKPITEKEKHNVLSNLDTIRSNNIDSFYTTKRIEYKWLDIDSYTVIGHNVDVSLPYTDIIVFNKSKLSKEFHKDKIGLQNKFEIASYFRAIAAGHTHREARFYMLYMSTTYNKSNNHTNESCKNIQ